MVSGVWPGYRGTGTSVGHFIIEIPRSWALDYLRVWLKREFRSSGCVWSFNWLSFVLRLGPRGSHQVYSLL